jgi:hypothetical protein
VRQRDKPRMTIKRSKDWANSTRNRPEGRVVDRLWVGQIVDSPRSPQEAPARPPTVGQLVGEAQEGRGVPVIGESAVDSEGHEEQHDKGGQEEAESAPEDRGRERGRERRVLLRVDLPERPVRQDVSRDDEEDVDHGPWRIDHAEEGQLERRRRRPVLVQPIRLREPAQVLFRVMAHKHNERGHAAQAVEVGGRVQAVGHFRGRGTQPWLHEARGEARSDLLE